jgi:hypothetical protein
MKKPVILSAPGRGGAGGREWVVEVFAMDAHERLP